MREWALSGRDALTFTLTAAGDEPLPQELLVELETAVGTKVRLRCHSSVPFSQRCPHTY